MTAFYFWAETLCSAEDAETISWQLFEQGAEAVEEIEHAPGQVRLRVHLSEESLRDQLVAALPQLSFSIGQEENQDWDAHWRERQTPVQVSEGLQVCPPWVEPEHREGQIVLHIEAKMAFGTGEHESTRLCAQILESQIRRVCPERLLDIGAGTGVLAMYARKLGVPWAVMTEIDPVCSPCQEENFALNGLGDPVGILGGLEAFAQDGTFDLIVCNMIRSEIWPLRSEMLRLLAPGGRMILSGQLAAEDHFIREWWADDGLDVIEEAVDGDWWSVCGQRRS